MYSCAFANDDDISKYYRVPDKRVMKKRMMIIGGTGSLGHALVDHYLATHVIHIYSRDECKHWSMSLLYKNHPNLNFHIGNIRDAFKLRQTLLRVRPHIIICAAALKHIDRCEFASNECLDTNIKGTQNVLDAIEEIHQVHNQQCLECFCFVSTDKACSPVNLYGMSKAISECLVIEKARFLPTIKFVVVRYGNVLNSRGSIIPTLHRIGQDPSKAAFSLTDPRMTRFIMTLGQSVRLIEHAIAHGRSGEIIIPKLVSCRIQDLLEIFSELYAKPIVITHLRAGEKLCESLINETQSARLRLDEPDYHIIQPSFAMNESNALGKTDLQDFNSRMNPITKQALRELLEDLQLIDPATLPSALLHDTTTVPKWRAAPEVTKKTVAIIT